MTGHFAAVIANSSITAVESFKDILLRYFIKNFSKHFKASAIPVRGYFISQDDESSPENDNKIFMIMAGSPFFERIESWDQVRLKSLQRYRQQGIRFVNDLNGIFAGIIFDPQKQNVMVFIDRFGMQPLYIASGSEWILISTSALSMAHTLKSSFDVNGLIQFIGLRTLLGKRTLFKNIERFPPATILTQNSSGQQMTTYWEPRNKIDTKPFTSNSLKEAVELFNQSVKRRIPEDGIVGAGLTGGMDTRAILSSLLTTDAVIHAFTITGSKKNPENNIISQIVKNTGINHRFFVIDKDIEGNLFENLAAFTQELDGEVPGLVFYHVIPAYLQQRRRSTVLFVGTGGEIFRGEHYRIGYRRSTIEKSVSDHLANKLIYKRGFVNYLFSTPGPIELLRESISEELRTCECDNPWSTLDLFHMRNEVRRLGGGGIWTMNRYVKACVPFLDNDFVEFCLKFCSYDNNRSIIHSNIINENNFHLAIIPRRIDYGGSLRISSRPVKTFRAFNYFNLIRRLPIYIALHKFSIFHDNFGYRNILKNNLNDFNRLFDEDRLLTTDLYREKTLGKILEKERKNGFLHYYELGYILSIELLARHLRK